MGERLVRRLLLRLELQQGEPGQGLGGGRRARSLDDPPRRLRRPDPPTDPPEARL